MPEKLPVNYNALTQRERRVVREQYISEQDGKCHHCHAPLDGEPSVEIRSESINLRLFPPNFLSNPVHLHHNHNTGMTIGAVHARCNAVLWQYHGE
jgi:hypothetical protein